MTAQQWSKIYAREKESSGMDSAIATVVRGLCREAEYHRDAERSFDMWNEVAKDHPELKPDGLRRFVESRMP